MRDYTELPALQHFVLEESWVLSITAVPGVVSIELDVTFARDHPDLLPARDGEVVYSRRGTLRFSGVTSLSWTGQGGGPAIDATGETDWGAIDSMKWSGDSHELDGDFGFLRVEATSVGVTLTGPV